MIVERDLEQLALTWFQDTDWDYRRSPDIAANGDAPECTCWQAILPKLISGQLSRANVSQENVK